MPVFWLSDTDPTFPHPALAEPGGLLAIGGDLRAERLILAYQNGIFPWFEDGGYLYWYSPDPRCVLFPQELTVHKSMRSIFNRHKFRYTLDTCFGEVMRACAESPRYGQEGTWISDVFFEGYARLFEQGIAHSVEVWQDDTLIGGLYGLSLGRIFYGESMFSRVQNASKAGFITLVRALQQMGFFLVDCQQETPHLLRMGARSISRDLFTEYLTRNFYERTHIGRWNWAADGGIVVEKRI